MLGTCLDWNSDFVESVERFKWLFARNLIYSVTSELTNANTGHVFPIACKYFFKKKKKKNQPPQVFRCPLPADMRANRPGVVRAYYRKHIFLKSLFYKWLKKKQKTFIENNLRPTEMILVTANFFNINVISTISSIWGSR